MAIRNLSIATDWPKKLIKFRFKPKDSFKLVVKMQNANASDICGSSLPWIVDALCVEGVGVQILSMSQMLYQLLKDFLNVASLLRIMTVVYKEPPSLLDGFSRSVRMLALYFGNF